MQISYVIILFQEKLTNSRSTSLVDLQITKYLQSFQLFIWQPPATFYEFSSIEILENSTKRGERTAKSIEVTTMDINGRVNHVDCKMNRIDCKMNRIDCKMNRIDCKMKHIDGRVNHVD